MEPLPARAIPGIGYKAEKSLIEAGLHTIRALREVPLSTLGEMIGPQVAAFALEASWGRDSRRVVKASPPKVVKAHLVSRIE